MKAQLKTIKTEMAKEKSSSKAAGTADELQFLMNFNASITQAMAKTLKHLSDFVFVTVANTNLARRDSYLSHLKAGIKPDTLASLRTAPLLIPMLFPNEALRQAEQDIASFESKGQHQPGKKGRFHPYDRPDNRKQERPAWKNIGQRGQGKKSKGKASYYSSRPAKGQQSYKSQLLCKQFDRKTGGREHSSQTNRHFCKLKWCTLCSYCARAFAKERNKSRGSSLSFSEKLQNKICETCFLCHSIILCQTCGKCQKCCHKSTCRGQT